jgi:hypothetical protein
VALAERLGDPPRGDVDDLGPAVHAVGDDARLAAGERAGAEPEVGDGHGDQRHRDSLARRHQHVELAWRRHRADLLGEVEQVVGGVPHRGDGHDDVVAGLLRLGDPTSDPLDALGVGQRRSAVLLDDDGHVLLPKRWYVWGLAHSNRTSTERTRRPDAGHAASAPSPTSCDVGAVLAALLLENRMQVARSRHR